MSRLTRYLTLPDGFRPGAGWVYGAVEGKADCGPYTTGEIDVRWMSLLRVAPGTAAVYPVKLQVPGRGEGQFKFEEVEEWRIEADVLDMLVELDRHHDIRPELADRRGSALGPGIDPEWAWRVTERIGLR